MHKLEVNVHNKQRLRTLIIKFSEVTIRYIEIGFFKQVLNFNLVDEKTEETKC